MKDYFKNSLIFYYKDLVNKGFDDPVKIIIGDFVNTITITNEQQEYISKMTEQDKKMIDNLLILILKMKNDKEYDNKSLELLENWLRYLKG